jgi:integrase
MAEENKLTVGQVMDLYFEDREKEGKQIAAMRILWNANLKPVFGAVKPEDIKMQVYDVKGRKRTLAHKYALDRKDAGMSRATIYHELNILRTGIQWGAAEGRELIKFVKVWLPRRAAPRDSKLTWEEIFRVLDACRKWPHLELFMLLDILTTQRKAAILELEWSRVHLDRRQIAFERNRDDDDILDTGGRKGRSTVDMGDLLHEKLSEAKVYAQTPFVIEWRGRRVMDVKKGIKTAFKAAGIEKRFTGAHAIRKSVAGLLADAGAEMRRIQKLLGHHDIATTDRIYAHHSRGYLLQAVNLLEAIITSKDIEPIEPGSNPKGGVQDDNIEEEILASGFDEPAQKSNLKLESALKR